MHTVEASFLPRTGRMANSGRPVRTATHGELSSCCECNGNRHQALAANDARTASFKLSWTHIVLLASLIFTTEEASAHSFVVPYTLPVPFAIYVVGATTALLLSFLITALCGAGIARTTIDQHQRRRWVVGRQFIWLARTFSATLLGFTIVCGLAGTSNSFKNLDMTFFWVIVVLGMTYTVALFGDYYKVINPWLSLCLVLEKLSHGAFTGRLAYPPKWGYWPAFGFYNGFICVELFGHTAPRSLAVVLLVYTGLTVIFAWLFGVKEWFEKGEFFAVFFALVGRLACIEWSWKSSRVTEIILEFRRPFVGLLTDAPIPTSLVFFTLFMLSSTAFDGLHETLPWSHVYWRNLYPLFSSFLPSSSLKALSLSIEIYYVWQWCMLLLSSLIYYVVYILCLNASKLLMLSTSIRTTELAQRFAFSLIPIAFVYHLTHYYTLLIAQGPQTLTLISDPLGIGWNLFGTADWTLGAFMIDVETIWHTQVAFIVLGHIVGVYVAHIQAVRILGTSVHAATSQAPMLVLMMAFTTFGLFILSLPLSP